MPTYRTGKQAPAGGQQYRRPEQYYYDDVPSYRGGVGTANEGADDDDEADDDEETAVATDLSVMPPRPTQNSRAGFRSNPISDQVEFDKEAAPATVGPKRPQAQARFVDPTPPTRQMASSATLQVPGGRQRARSPAPDRAPRGQQQQQYRQPARFADEQDDDDSEEDTVVDDPYSRQPPPPRAQPIRRTAATPPPPPRAAPAAQYARPPPQQYAYPSSSRHSQQGLQYRQAAHGYSERDDEDEEEAPDSDDDAFTAVGTGVATDLSLDDPDEIAMDHRGMGYQQPMRTQQQPQPRGAPAPRDDYREMRRALPVQRNPYAQQQEEDDNYSDASTPVPVPTRRLTAATAAAPLPRSAPLASAHTDLPQHSQVERELIQLLKEMNFSVALKDLHDHLGLGVQKTLVAEDGMGHAYCKVHCKKLPRHDAVEREAHLKNHWVPLAGARWEFRTTSHRVTIVWKTTAVGAYESAGLLGRR